MLSHKCSYILTLYRRCTNPSSLSFLFFLLFIIRIGRGTLAEVPDFALQRLCHRLPLGSVATELLGRPGSVADPIDRSTWDKSFEASCVYRTCLSDSSMILMSYYRNMLLRVSKLRSILCRSANWDLPFAGGVFPLGLA